MLSLIEFPWSTFALLDAGVNVFVSTVTYPLYHNRVHEYLFSVSDNNETKISMETKSPNVALLCVHSTSVTNSQTCYLSQQNLH